jgi:desulfoferrodoxin (superoxide reductase-like protein)
MKKIRITVIAVLLLFATLALSAHPSKNMKLSYSEGVLTVEIFHSTPNPQKHYIKEVSISINKKKAITEKYESQPDRKSFTYTYEIMAKKGDKISVKTVCSIFGKETKEIEID